jgi:hypothetical protein
MQENEREIRRGRKDGCGKNLLTHIAMRQDLLSDEPPN